MESLTISPSQSNRLKRVLSHPQLSILGVLVLLSGLFLTINAAQENQDKRSRAAGIATADLSDPSKKDIAMQLVSSAENSSLNWKGQYSYIEDIGDGRGYTGGIIGFCSGTSDMLAMVKYYTKIAPGNILAKYIPALEKVDGTASHTGLGTAYVNDWKTAAKDPLFQKAQNDERDRVYFNPAVAQAKADGLRALGQFIYYDSMVMHGDGNDSASFTTQRKKALLKAKTPAQGGNETTYLNAFLNERVAAMKQEAAHEDTSRVDTAQRVFLNAGNFDLNPPLSWKVYGDPYTINAYPNLPTTTVPTIKPSPTKTSEPADSSLATETITLPKTICNTTGQLCSPMHSETIQTDRVLKVNYTVGVHCSPVRIHFYLNGVKKYTSGWLGWTGATGSFSTLPLGTGNVDLGPVSPGSYTVALQGEGQLGGCNTGKLNAWLGSIIVTTSTTPLPTDAPEPTDVPEPTDAPEPTDIPQGGNDSIEPTEEPQGGDIEPTAEPEEDQDLPAEDDPEPAADPDDIDTPDTSEVPTAIPGRQVTNMRVKVSVKYPGIGQGANVSPRHLSRRVTITVFNLENDVVLKGTGFLTYDNRNLFKGVVQLGTMREGTYYLKVVGEEQVAPDVTKATTLQATVVPEFQKLLGDRDNVLPPVTLIQGDLDTDNAITLIDYNLALSCFQAKGCVRSPELGSTFNLLDFNDDGKVNVIDYNILLRNFFEYRGD